MTIAFTNGVAMQGKQSTAVQGAGTVPSPTVARQVQPNSQSAVQRKGKAKLAAQTTPAAATSPPSPATAACIVHSTSTASTPPLAAVSLPPVVPHLALAVAPAATAGAPTAPVTAVQPLPKKVSTCCASCTSHSRYCCSCAIDHPSGGSLQPNCGTHLPS